MPNARSPADAAHDCEEIEIATFYLGDLLLGIVIGEVEEISRLQVVTPVPGAPACVRGVMSLRGEVVTVLDLRVVFGLGTTPCGCRTRNVIVQQSGEKTGLLVDGVADVIRARRSELLPPPANLNGADCKMFRAVYRLENDLVAVVDVAAVTAADALRGRPDAVR